MDDPPAPVRESRLSQIWRAPSAPPLTSGGFAHMTKQRMAISVLALLCAVAIATPAFAGGTPAQKCAASKMKAAGKKYAGRAKCYAKALGTGSPVSNDCLQKVEDKFAAAF